jgi:hypothetical protein
MTRDFSHGFTGSSDPLPRRSAVVLIAILMRHGWTVEQIAAGMGCQPRMVYDAQRGKILSERFATRLERLVADLPKSETAPKPEAFHPRVAPRYGR